MERQLWRETQNYIGQNFRGGYRDNNRNGNFGGDRCRSRDRQYSGKFSINDINSSSSGLGSRASTNRDRIRCFKCWEYVILLRTVQIHKQKKNLSKYNKCII